MDLKRRLEEEHSKELTLLIVEYVRNNAMRFKELMSLFLIGQDVVRQRASWAIGYAGIENRTLLTSYYGRLIKKLEAENLHPAETRNIFRIFQETGVPEKYSGPLLDICYRHITSQLSPAATRAMAITTASSICNDYPELQKELFLIMDELKLVPQPPAVLQRIKLAVKQRAKVDSKV